MPIYEFCCKNCQHISTVFSRKVSPVMPSECPNCGSKELVQAFTGFAYHRSEAQRMDPAAMWQARKGSWEESKLQDMGMKAPGECMQTLYEAKLADIEAFKEVCGKRALEQCKDDLP